MSKLLKAILYFLFVTLVVVAISWSIVGGYSSKDFTQNIAGKEIPVQKAVSVKLEKYEIEQAEKQRKMDAIMKEKASEAPADNTKLDPKSMEDMLNQMNEEVNDKEEIDAEKDKDTKGNKDKEIDKNKKPEDKKDKKTEKNVKNQPKEKVDEAAPKNDKKENNKK